MRKDDLKGSDAGAVMEMDKVEGFLRAWSSQGRSEESRNIYRRALRSLCDFLPEDKRIRKGTMTAWREWILENGYLPSTVNVMTTAGNQFLDYIGRSEYQIPKRLKIEPPAQPEVTRAEYLRLLEAAKAQGNEKLYLMVKVFACTGIYALSLPMVTVENVRKGRFQVTYQGARNTFRVPACLQRELLDYAEGQGIKSGPIFLTKIGTTPSHTYISHSISNLCAAAHVPEEKGNPRCLRRLYLTTRANIESDFELLVEQTMDRQLEQEQLAVGWNI